MWEPVSAMKSSSFTFALTGSDGARRFGFCRKFLPDGNGARMPEVLCLVAAHPWFSMFDQILDIAEERCRKRAHYAVAFLKAALDHPFPLPGEAFTVRCESTGNVQYKMDAYRLVRPDDDLTPFASVRFDTLFRLLSLNSILLVFSAVLCERRVVFAAESVQDLTRCVHAVMAALYPLQWQHVFVPVLPPSLLSYVCAPMPFVVGIHASLWDELLEMPKEDVVLVRLDKDEVFSNEGLILPLPSAGERLGKRLRSEVVRSSGRDTQHVLDDFIAFHVALLGRYKRYICEGPCSIDSAPQSDEFWFDIDAFIREHPSRSAQRFLEEMRHSQAFHQFITERLVQKSLRRQSGSRSLFDRAVDDEEERHGSSAGGGTTGELGSRARAFSRQLRHLGAVSASVTDRLRRGIGSALRRDDSSSSARSTSPTPSPQVATGSSFWERFGDSVVEISSTPSSAAVSPAASPRSLDASSAAQLSAESQRESAVSPPKSPQRDLSGGAMRTSRANSSDNDDRKPVEGILLDLGFGDSSPSQAVHTHEVAAAALNSTPQAAVQPAQPQQEALSGSLLDF